VAREKAPSQTPSTTNFITAIDREENIRRIGTVAQLFSESGIIALTAFISPYRIDRDRVRNNLLPGEFIEVFVDTPLRRHVRERSRASPVSMTLTKPPCRRNWFSRPPRKRLMYSRMR
jgi:hypothetical protein